MQGKKVIAHNGNVANAYTDTQMATGLLDYAHTLVHIINTNTSGDDGTVQYKVFVTPDSEQSSIDWNARVSGQTITAGGTAIHKFTDAWDGVKVQLRNNASGTVCQTKVYITRKPR
uniref:Uncharacterized protein n=1 Tax=viral metagenome TaxID=1070528 RepID=A0A6M3JMY8_9ZZZZ